MLEDFGNEIVTKYRSELESRHLNASHRLADSVTVIRPDKNGNPISLSLSLEPYYKYLEEGRPPTHNGGNGELRKAIRKWLEVKMIMPTPMKGNNLPVDKQLDQMAYLIARKIHKEGYESKGHPLQDSIDEVWALWEFKIEEAIDADINDDIDFVLLSIFKS